MIDQIQWDLIRQQAKETLGLPEWATEICQKKNLQDIIQHISIESKEIDQSYIDFLHEQIALNTRGEEWTNLLQRRQIALNPYVSKSVSLLSYTDENRVLWIRFDPETNLVIFVEAH